MWMMLQREEPDDFVIATGETHSVREFVEKAFIVIGITIAWEGEGINEVGINSATKEVLVRIDERYFRPTEVEFLLGDPAKANQKLGWTCEVTFEELVKEMVKKDIEFLADGRENE
jgi:GDPmannose 4,6-dehydratase